MIKDKKIVCLIVAKKNSRELKNKNILKINGKPLIYWTFHAANKSKYIDYKIISTDSKKIAKIAKQNNISVPFMRPKKLANYNSSIYDVIKHAKKFFNKIDKFDYLILLQPTTPFRTYKHIDLAIKKFENTPSKNRRSLISVKKSPKINNWLLQKKDQLVNLVIKKSNQITNRQNAKELYLPNGGIFICSLKNYKNNFYLKKIVFFLMDKISSIDIDNKEDFIFAKKHSKLLNHI